MKKRIVVIIVAVVLLLAAGGIYLYFYLQPEPPEPPPEDPEAFTEFYRNEILAYIDSIIATTPEDSVDNYSLPEIFLGPVFDIHSVNSLKKIRSYIANSTSMEDMTALILGQMEIPQQEIMHVLINGNGIGSFQYFSFYDEGRNILIWVRYTDSDKKDFCEYIVNAWREVGIESRCPYV